MGRGECRAPLNTQGQVREGAGVRLKSEEQLPGQLRPQGLVQLMPRWLALRRSMPPVAPGREVGALDCPLPVGPLPLCTTVASTGPPAQNLTPAPIDTSAGWPPHLYLCAGHPGRPSGQCPVSQSSLFPRANESRATSLLSALLSDRGIP